MKLLIVQQFIFVIIDFYTRNKIKNSCLLYSLLNLVLIIINFLFVYEYNFYFFFDVKIKDKIEKVVYKISLMRLII